MKKIKIINKKVTEFYKKNKKLALFIILAIFAILIFSILGITKLVQYNIDKLEAKKIDGMEWHTYNVNGKEGDVLVTFADENGIDEITDFNNQHIEVNGKMKIAFDYKMKVDNTYAFKVKYKDNTEKSFTIDYDIPRIKGEYVLKNGIYVNKPDVSSGFDKLRTRYMYLDKNKNLVPGNWLNGEEPKDWWDYNTQNWANILVENEGVESYYVWIPRYCYKVDTDNSLSGNERMDIKFINTDNEYIDALTGETTSWEDLEKAGYKIPEAFSWKFQYEYDVETIIPGYWSAKYQLSDLSSYNLSFVARVSVNSIEINSITVNSNKTVANYTYAIDGKILETKTESTYTFENLTEGYKDINVTALDENGEIIGSMTKTFIVIEPNPPDISKFNSETTYYVWWEKDENGNEIEHNDIPISEEAPEGWYNYGKGYWANIVTKANETNSYFVWIPRYQYKLDSVSQKSDIKFIKGTSTETDEGYKIPEAFTWQSQYKNDDTIQLTGYWAAKYQLSQ